MEKAKKKQLKKVFTWVSLAALVVLLAAMPLLARKEAEEDGPVASVLTDTVKTGSVSTAIHGGGTLSVPDAENIEIPSDVKITEFLVKNGDYITEGTPIAAVDKVSVMTAITSVTESMEQIQDEIESAREESVSSTIAATAGGRVKVIYAEAGDDVQDVMLRDGALAVLSLDSLMAVKLSGDMAVQPGETVTVALSDGTKIEGRVESNLNGEIVITVEDEGYPIGEKITVTTGGGTPMGTGELYVHNQWTAAGVTGTISTVNCKEETKVYSGSTLFTLKDTEFESELQYLSSLHREYEELLQRLFRMHETGTIDAPCGGLVSGIDKDSAHLLAAGEGDWEMELLDAPAAQTQEKGWKIVLLSGEGGSGQTTQCTGDESCPLESSSENHREDCIKKCDRTKDCDAKVHYADCYTNCISSDGTKDCPAAYHKETCIESCVHAAEGTTCPATGKHYIDCVKNCIIGTESKECAAGKHYADCIRNCTGKEDCTAKNHYSTCVSRCDMSENCPAERHKEGCYLMSLTYYGTFYKINQVGIDGLIVDVDTGGYRQVALTSSGWAAVGTDSLKFMKMENPLPIEDASKYQGKEGSVILVWDGYKGDTLDRSGVAFYQEVSNSSPNINDLLDKFGSLGNMFSAGGYTYGGTVQEIEDDLYPLEGDTLATVTPQNTMVLTIAVDEQDIARLSPGMTAQIEVNALRGETFQGTVTRVGISGTNNGGSSKFPVEITMAMTTQVIDGMSAAATIGLDTLEDVLTIPVAALNRENNKTVVYTAVSEETGEPSGAVEVETGVSDGTNVQILSGLKAGDSICYSYYDQVALDNSAKADKYSFG